MAEAENHSAIAITWQKAMIVMDARLESETIVPPHRLRKSTTRRPDARQRSNVAQRLGPGR